ncbi:PREDICTED: uncharacterized protein LOC108373829 [Rhagoletis zephyria]|uniref:uncharacterized protein LOC108373829 n=1 Tax=Rhagoletis zephyria TaxID=28612 RepID=UPI000811526C|nr:PREDICTED: uncharacterized protein LOC108373829 [Rhagoletis zephyria]
MKESRAEVEIEWLKNFLLPEILKNKHFREDSSLRGDTNDKVKIHDVQVKFIGAEEAFMLTICYRAVIILEEGDSGPVTNRIIVKKTPNLTQETYDLVQFGSLFSNEILAYNTIMPAIENLAPSTFNTPRFYFGELHKNSATVVLQDFGVNSWRVAKQKANLSLAHALVAVSNLGTFHGTSFAIRYKNQDEFERLTKDLREPRFELDEMHPVWKLMTQYGAERIVKAAQKYYPDIDEEFLRRYQRLIENYVEFGRKMVAPVEPLVTLCHGDYLRNNLAFKYEESNGTEEPIDSLMFDLQTIRVSSPMLDFATFLSLSTYAAVRRTHFDQIFDEYYEKLIAAFKKTAQGAEVPHFLSRESILREYWRLFPYTASIASHFLMQLVDRNIISIEEASAQPPTPEEVREDTLQRGGEEVDRELSNQLKDVYDLVQEHKLDIFEGFDYV